MPAPDASEKPFRTVEGESVQFNVSPFSACPCGNGRVVSQCCLTNRGFIKKATATSPVGPRTSRSLLRCYAAPLKDCSGKLSREHYISENLLYELNRLRDLRVSGFKWQANREYAPLSPNSLASKVLCDRHNTALSSIDAIALHLFRALDEENAAGSGQRLLFLLSGHDIERWLLKVLCGLSFSGAVALDRETDMTIPKQWIEVLFGFRDFDAGQGLHLQRDAGAIFEGPRGLLVAPMARKGKLIGISVAVCGYDLILAMVPIPDRVMNGQKLVYRPLELYARGRDYEKSVMFSWTGQADLGTLSVTIGET